MLTGICYCSHVKCYLPISKPELTLPNGFYVLTDVFLKFLEIDSDQQSFAPGFEHMNVRRHNLLINSPVGSHVTRDIHTVEYT